ncbi:tryptophan 7-halogenase [Caulobacter sp. BE254]|uniref:tryptophan halogenase family protein n=1 Tax=Caulobacter sp. BE254 TaxID=2817720 RepID=UPI002856DF05|nr:tryptophan 7-halogenase [Caulobacter sp. BE254]MDR7117622.1 tryptophan halogenase [Caulobacter sp. BE254]
MTDRSINDILIVGGGTAGWMTAAYLARRLGSTRPDGVRVTLIESSEIGIIGVGEGTFPTIQNTMRTLGVDEARFLREAGAAFKQGIKFVDWKTAPRDGVHSHYYHPFAQPRLLNGGLDLAPYWLMGEAGDIPFSDAVTLQDKVCEAMRGPKRRDDPQYGGPMAYAYHFDAGKLATLLRDVGKATGVRHLLGNVLAVNKADDGAIASVTTREYGDLAADLYVDCTGFAGALIGEAMGSAWIDKGDTLFVDRALALQVPYDRPDAPVATTTISTAHEAGWTWDIGLPDRRGTGYVYSSRHTTDDRAEQVLRGYVGQAGDGLTPRLLKLKVGHRQAHWIKNCVAVGLSGGFLEPLESTGIVLIEAAAYMLARNLPRRGGMEAAARQFNAAMTDRYLRAIDFIKLHYCLSQRTDNRFWTDNADPASIPETLRDHLAMWKHRPPNVFDFPNLHESFKYFNYQYILYGMGFETQVDPAAHIHGDLARADFARVREAGLRAAASLPDHRALLTDVYARGFSTKAPDLATIEAGEAPRR